jgi:sugar O-acyltransferase (sialic acid O-acetyltransferase NeuD family)
MDAIYCAGEQGRVVLDIIRTVGDATDIVFLDDDENCHGKKVDGVPVVGGSEVIAESDEGIECIVAFGDRPSVRLKIAETIETAGATFGNAIHPASTLSESCNLGEGVMVNAQSYVGPGATIGDHVLIDSCVNVSHDATLEPGVTVTPNATIAGGVTVHRNGYVGPNATIIEDITVGAGSVIGAGAVVTDSVDDGDTVVGVPARPI